MHGERQKFTLDGSVLPVKPRFRTWFAQAKVCQRSAAASCEVEVYCRCSLRLCPLFPSCCLRQTLSVRVRWSLWCFANLFTPSMEVGHRRTVRETEHYWRESCFVYGEALESVTCPESMKLFMFAITKQFVSCLKDVQWIGTPKFMLAHSSCFFNLRLVTPPPQCLQLASSFVRPCDWEHLHFPPSTSPLLVQAMPARLGDPNRSRRVCQV